MSGSVWSFLFVSKQGPENVLDAYRQLRDNAEDGHHILSSLPTGMGKTLPMIVASCLLPPGELSLFSMKRNESCLSMPRRNLLSLLQIIFQGSTTMIIVPLTTIKQQLEEDCTRLGISFLVGDQVNSRLDSVSLSH